MKFIVAAVLVSLFVPFRSACFAQSDFVKTTAVYKQVGPEDSR